MTDTPYVRVVRGVPTPEELAALVGVLATRSRPAVSTPAAVSWWARSARPAAVEARSWRASALPR